MRVAIAVNAVTCKFPSQSNQRRGASLSIKRVNTLDIGVTRKEATKISADQPIDFRMRVSQTKRVGHRDALDDVAKA